MGHVPSQVIFSVYGLPNRVKRENAHVICCSALASAALAPTQMSYYVSITPVVYSSLISDTVRCLVKNGRLSFSPQSLLLSFEDYIVGSLFIRPPTPNCAAVDAGNFNFLLTLEPVNTVGKAGPRCYSTSGEKALIEKCNQLRRPSHTEVLSQQEPTTKSLSSFFVLRFFEIRRAKWLAFGCGCGPEAEP